jgi:hypothetical protein
VIDAQSTTRYTVSTSESALTVDARSTLHATRSTVCGVAGYVVTGWNADGSLASSPEPAMHVEFPVDQLRSGNGLQDREMQKLVDSKRFPKVAADLRSVTLLAPPNRYKATGDVVLAGRSRSYDGEFSIAHDGDRVTIDGELSLDIRDFGLKPPSLLILKVDPVVKIRMRLVARKAA